MAARPQRKQHSQSVDETSPFSTLKSTGAGVDHGYILRTRSLELDSPVKRGGDNEHSQNEEPIVATALHSSFDAAFTTHEGNVVCGWDETDADPNNLSELSGKKHSLPRGASTEALKDNPPGTVRKLARRTANGNELCSKTPGRPRLRPPGSSNKKPSCSNTTPSSAVKRRLAPLPQRLSPMRRVPLITSPIEQQQSSSLSFGDGLTGTSFVQSPPTLTPTHQGGAFGSTMKSMSKWHNTGTTAASSTLLETTFESDTSSSSPTTRFRFTSFPASLPRVNNPRNRPCPDSVRKRMSFADTSSALSTSEVNQSRDDDGTQNTSISSLSAEGNGHHRLPHIPPGSHPPAILELNSNSQKGSEDLEEPFHGQLFSDEDCFGYSDDDDDSADSPVRGIVTRTRLNFNMILSPASNEEDDNRATGENTLMPLVSNMELARPYEQRRINSFPSSLSSNTHMHELGGALTPARSGQKEVPMTPREVQLQFSLEAECSPIPGMRDNDNDDQVLEVRPDTTSEASSGLVGNGLLLSRPNHSGFSDSIISNSNNKDQKSTKEEGSTASESTNGKSRRLRPMPDMSAFEFAAVSSRGDRSDDSTTLDSKGMPSSQRLLCPPTPVRTPAWAYESGLGARQHSLITTKVLLACPSQVVQGRCSLESSVLDDDNNSKASGRILRVIPASREGGVNVTKGGDNRWSDISDAPEWPGTDQQAKTPHVRIQAPPRLNRRFPSSQEIGSVISFSNDFEFLSVLGSGAFADVYKVRSTRDDRLYAVKRNRRQFRGKRDRDVALAEVQSMQRLQKVCAETGGNKPISSEKSSYCLYLLFFYRAWQEDGYFFCQTELCCRDTCRELLDSLRFLWNPAKNKYPSLLRTLPAPEGIEPGSDSDVSGRLVPNMTVWKICHDISAGLSHIHSHGLVHQDLKPSNIFFVVNPRFGAMCKIGDFGMAGDIGSSGDGQEGDARYMPPELLSSGARQPSSDIFSLGLTLYEIATDQHVEMPSEGPRWHELRSANGPQLPECRDDELLELIQLMTNPCQKKRPTADAILKNEKATSAGHGYDSFLGNYIRDIEEYDRIEDERHAMEDHEDQTPRNGSHRSGMVPVRSPSLSMLLPAAPVLLSPLAHHLH